MTDQRLRDLGDADFRARYECSRFDAAVLGNRFAYILEHFCSKLLACAFSPILRNFYDFAATISGPPERGYPTPAVSRTQILFTGTMTDAIRNSIEEYGIERLEPGDVLIANDPHRIGTHVNDMLFIRPVFHDGVLSAFVNLKCHQLDIGGAVPGGFSVTKTTSYENGLVLSPRALIKAGKPVPETWSLIFDNVRFSDIIRRDMQTIVACLALGDQLLVETMDRYGRAAVLGAMDYVCDADAERMRTALEQLPDGDWQGAALVDCDGMDENEEYPVHCSIRKRGGRIEVDVSGTARQARTSINGTYLDAKTTVGIVLKFLLDPHGAFTSGCYRPIDIVIPDGTIMSALPPDGAVNVYPESTSALLTAMYSALAEPLGLAAVGGDFGASIFHTAHGRHAEGSLWVSAGVGGSERGAWGGTSAGDGDSFSTISQSNWMEPAIEVAEAEEPLVILRREYLPDFGGAGENRGGTAVAKDTLWLTPANHTFLGHRFKQAPGKGVRGGKDGRTGGIWLWEEPGTAPYQHALSAWSEATTIGGRLNALTNAPDPAGEWQYPCRRSWSVAGGSTFRALNNGAGGWGDPFRRDPGRVLADVRDGYVTIEGARLDYGVCVTGDPEWDPEGLAIDRQATDALRSAGRAS